MSDFTDVIANGSHREQLIALRDFLALKLESCMSPRDQAPLAAQLRQVLLDLDSLPMSGEGSIVDDLAAQRAIRRQKAATS